MYYNDPNVLTYFDISIEQEKVIRKALLKAAKELFKKYKKDRLIESFYDIEPESSFMFIINQYLSNKK